MSSRDQKIIKYRRPLRINMGVIIFAIMFVYIFISIRAWSDPGKVSFYEVTEGSMAKNTEQTGIAVREERVQYSDRSGYVSFLLSEGRRAAVGTDVYTIDETGALNSFLKSNSDLNTALSEENIHKLQKKLSDFSAAFSRENFRPAYDIKTQVLSLLSEYTDLYAGDELEALMKANGISCEKFRSPYSGTVSYAIDGFEERTPESIGESDFQEGAMQVRRLSSGQLVEKNAPVYKIVTSETWSILFPLSEEQRLKYAEKSSMKVSFTGTDIEASGRYMQVSGTDGKYYGRITLDKYMVDFIGDRYVSFDIASDTEQGLKIPRTAVVNKLFMTVPVEYLTHGGDGTEDGFYKEVITDNGTGVVFVPMTLYHNDGSFYYIDMSIDSPLQPGDYLVMPETGEKYRLGSTGSLDGVYNINKGYTVFRKIEVIDAGEEYYIVRKNTRYGLNVYDHILFDPEGYSDGDFIYR